MTLSAVSLQPTHFPQAGKPQPIPTKRYIKKTTTTQRSTMILTFFHHICLRNPRLLTRKSLALPPNLSVLSTKRSILSPLSSTLSMFSVMMCFTSSISRLALLSASAGGAVLYVLSIDLRAVLKAAEPYGGRDWKFVLSGAY